MAKLETVQKCRKDQGKCGKCGVEIKKGDSYRYWVAGFRGPTHVRCTKTTCTPKPSELENNETRSTVLAAIEEAEDALTVAATLEDLESIRDQLVNTVRDNAIDGLQEKIDNVTETFTSGTPFTEEAEDLLAQLEDWCDNLENEDFSEEEYSDDNEEMKSDAALAFETAKEELEEIISESPI